MLDSHSWSEVLERPFPAGRGSSVAGQEVAGSIACHGGSRALTRADGRKRCVRKLQNTGRDF